MTVSKVDSDALEQCRVTVSGQAAQFGGLGDGFAKGGVHASIFGKLSASGGLSSAVDGFNTTVGGELAAAESVLHGVERALDAVRHTVADTEQANTRGMTPTA